jgi:hypothetical protein
MQWKRDIIFGRWNVRSLYRSGSLTAAARELARYKLDLVGRQQVRLGRGGIVRTQDYIFCNRKGNENQQLATVFYVHHRMISAAKRESLLVMGCHIMTRGHWCNITVLNVHTPSD